MKGFNRLCPNPLKCIVYMSKNAVETPKSNQPSFLNNTATRIVALAGVLFLFLVALKIMGDSFKLFGSEFSDGLVSVTSNPIVALFIGLLATAIIQSSSTTTSMIVAMIAAQVGIILTGRDPQDPETVNLIAMVIRGSVPMIMGANIGTSVTSTIISLGHIGKRQEFRKAVAAATVHDFFNIITVLVVLPLEYFFGVLSTTSIYFAELITSQSIATPVVETEKVKGIMAYTVKPVASWLMSLTTMFSDFGAGHPWKKGIPWATLPLGLGLLFLSLRWLTKLLKKLLIGTVQDRIDRILFGNPLLSMVWGTGITAMVQSSSVTSSLTVPLVATNKVSLRKAFPFLMGANIGTTTTAIIAAAVSNSPAALAVAFCHLLFNVVGVFLIFPIPWIRSIPVRLARKLGMLTLKNRLVGVGYVVVTFFIIPLGLLLASGRLDFSDKEGDSEDAAIEEVGIEPEHANIEEEIVPFELESGGSTGGGGNH